MQGEDRIRKLHWMCRRGMKELDVLLEAFLEKNIDDLKSGSWQNFESLLGQEDDQLWDWLQNTKQAACGNYSSLITAIRRGS